MLSYQSVLRHFWKLSRSQQGTWNQERGWCPLSSGSWAYANGTFCLLFSWEALVSVSELPPRGFSVLNTVLCLPLRFTVKNQPLLLGWDLAMYFLLLSATVTYTTSYPVAPQLFLECFLRNCPLTLPII